MKNNELLKELFHDIFNGTKEYMALYKDYDIRLIEIYKISAEDAIRYWHPKNENFDFALELTQISESGGNSTVNDYTAIIFIDKNGNIPECEICNHIYENDIVESGDTTTKFLNEWMTDIKNLGFKEIDYLDISENEIDDPIF